MAYIKNIPLANEKLSQSQPKVYNNFLSLGNMLTPDFGTIRFPLQAAAQNTAVGEIAVYSKTGTGIPAIQSIFWREPNNTVPGVGERDMTSFQEGANGFSHLPSGLILQWGTNVSSSTVTFPKPFTTVYSITATETVSDDGHFDIITIRNLTNVNFVVQLHQAGGTQALISRNFYWMAIGK